MDNELFEKLEMIEIKKDNRRRFVNVLMYVLLFFVLILLGDTTYGLIIGGNAKWFYFVYLIILGIIFSIIVFKKKIFNKKSIIISFVLCIIFISLSFGGYYMLNNIGAVYGEAVSTVDGRVVNTEKSGIFAKKYHIVNIFGDSFDIRTSKDLHEEINYTVKEYDGNFGIPVYDVIEE